VIFLRNYFLSHSFFAKQTDSCIKWDYIPSYSQYLSICQFHSTLSMRYSFKLSATLVCFGKWQILAEKLERGRTCILVLPLPHFAGTMWPLTCGLIPRTLRSCLKELFTWPNATFKTEVHAAKYVKFVLHHNISISNHLMKNLKLRTLTNFRLAIDPK